MCVAVLTACSTTSALEEGEQLFVGLKKIDFNGYESSMHQKITQDEVEAALATAPNGALFGSSYYRTPLPYGLWIWNAFSQSKTLFAKWAVKSFGKAPVLMNNVNPSLRSLVGKTVLNNNGYLHGNVTYDIEEGKPERTKTDSVLRPRTAKVQYHVNFGPLFMIDSVSYSNYPEDIYNRIVSTKSLISKGNPFSVSKLDEERTRIYKLLRNNGYYYYQPSYTSYLADTLQKSEKVHLQLHFADSLPEEVTRKWVIGKTSVQIRRQMTEAITDTMTRRFLSISFGGKKSPLRPRIILSDMKNIRSGDLFSQDAYQESLNALSSKGIFSSVDITFKPRMNADGTYMSVPDTIDAKNGESRAGAGVLDMFVNTVLDKPYDYTFQATAKGKSNGRLGPGLSVGLTKRNAFRGGELLSAEIGANYEFQIGGDVSFGNSYDFLGNISLQMPRMLVPSFIVSKRKRWYSNPSTLISLSAETIRRAGFFNRNVMSAEFSYVFQTSESSLNHFSPLIITYGRTTNISDAYLEKISKSAYSLVSAQNEMSVKMRYKYTYSSPKNYRNPIFWETTVSEAGNIVNLLSMAFDRKKWNDKERKLLGTPFAQFAKIETDFRKTWYLGEKSSFLLHFFGGIMFTYGNSSVAPFSEHYFIGGANDMRGFSMRSIGPGSLHFDDYDLAYLFHNGDVKAVLNLEYRPRLFGSLYGALFIDAGNIWAKTDKMFDEEEKEFVGKLGNAMKFDVGVDVGVGLRYDLDFFVLRLDWGFAIHNPYPTEKSGFFNMRDFSRMQCINFAIGYPF